VLEVVLLRALAEDALERGSYGDALDYLGEGLSVARLQLSEDRIVAADLSNGCGVCCKYLGRFDDARRYYEEALDIYVKHRGGAGRIAAVHHNLAGLAHELQSYEEAERLARVGIAARRLEVPADRRALAGDIAGLAAILDGMGQHEAAMEMHESAIATFVEVLGPRHAEVALARSNLATSLHKAGRSDEAWTCFAEALRLTEEVLGAAHPSVAVTLHNISIVALGMGREKEARAFAARAHALFEASLGREHPRTTAARRAWKDKSAP